MKILGLHNRLIVSRISSVFIVRVIGVLGVCIRFFWFRILIFGVFRHLHQILSSASPSALSVFGVWSFLGSYLLFSQEFSCVRFFLHQRPRRFRCSHQFSVFYRCPPCVTVTLKFKRPPSPVCFSGRPIESEKFGFESVPCFVRRRRFSLRVMIFVRLFHNGMVTGSKDILVLGFLHSPQRQFSFVVPASGSALRVIFVGVEKTPISISCSLYRTVLALPIRIVITVPINFPFIISFHFLFLRCRLIFFSFGIFWRDIRIFRRCLRFGRCFSVVLCFLLYWFAGGFRIFSNGQLQK